MKRILVLFLTGVIAMNPIQTSRKVEKIKLPIVPWFEEGLWVWEENDDIISDLGVEIVMSDVSYKDMPYPQGTMDEWFDTVNNIMINYWYKYLLKYNISIGEYKRQLNIPWKTSFIRQMLSYYAMFYLGYQWADYYYHQSVGDNKPGYTWKTAVINWSFYINPIMRRESVIRYVREGNKNIKYSTLYPGILETEEVPHEHMYEGHLYITIKGEYKYYNEDHELVREKAETIYERWFPSNPEGK